MNAFEFGIWTGRVMPWMETCRQHRSLFHEQGVLGNNGHGIDCEQEEENDTTQICVKQKESAAKFVRQVTLASERYCWLSTNKSITIFKENAHWSAQNFFV